MTDDEMVELMKEEARLMGLSLAKYLDLFIALEIENLDWQLAAINNSYPEIIPCTMTL